MNFCKTKSQILRFRKMAQVICVVLICAGCQTQSPAANVKQPKTETQKNIEAQTLYNKIIFVGSKKLNVQIVKTPNEMAQGLSGRNKLDVDEGMLFDFRTLYKIQESPSTSSGQNFSKPKFWMKDMNFDLDLIWIANKKVVGITNNVPAPKSAGDVLPTYSPPTDVDMVLEVNAGWSRENEIKIGDSVE